MPDTGPTVATPGLLLLHVPPVVASLSVTAYPWQMVVVPVIGATVVTVAVREAIQPAGVVYRIVLVPAASAVTIPEERPIVAVVVLVLLHVPPGIASLRVAVLPEHNSAGPVIAASGLTETVVAA